MTKRTFLRLTLAAAALALAGRAPVLAQTPAGPAGHWEGAIQLPDRELGIAVDLFAEADGKWEATITIAAQNIKAMPLADVTVKGDTVGFAMRGVPGDPVFAGTVSKDGKSITGEFSQGGATLPFSLAWKSDAKREPAPVSTPIDKALEGTWEGTLDARGTLLRLVVKLSSADGRGKGTIVSVDQGGVEIPIAAVQQDGPRLTLDVRMIIATYEGELKDGQIVGTWTQGPMNLPLVLKRAATPVP